MHFVEGVFDGVEADAFGDEFVEGESALEVEVDEGGEVAFGRQSPYQEDLRAPPREKKSTSGISRVMSG